ncbi:MAG: hypothetical protein K1X51_04895 [Rhodospirillaceae bacterium]|nr:hypothetical protein [Rhodospirillaceae bacterium]
MNRDNLNRIPFVIAVALTMLWVAVMALYSRKLGVSGLAALTPAEMATLLAAGGGPPVVLWLFVAVMEQRRVVTQLLAQNRQALQQSETQARALLTLQSEMTRARSAASHDLALRDLAASAAVLAERLGVINRENSPAAWARFGAGDVTVFVQSFLTFAVSHPDMAERMADAVNRDAVARAALAGFVRRYQRLTDTMDDKMTLEVIEEGALGRAFRLFRAADDAALARAQAREPESVA